MMFKGMFRYMTVAMILAASSVLPQANAQSITSDGELYVSEGRIGGLIAGLDNRPIVETTLAKIERLDGDGPGVWSYEWRLMGEYYESLGDRYAKRGESEEAINKYEGALRLYNMGYLPGNYSPSERRSYMRFRDVAYKINEHLTHPFVVVKIPFEGKEIITHLYRPAGVEQPPLVLYTGGTDGSKETSRSTTQSLAAEGFAVVTFDLAGTGESMDWFARPDSHKLHKRILDYFEDSGDYDFSRVGLIGGSFGGYYVVRMAAEDRRVKAAINHCGLVHSAFQVPAEDIPNALAGPAGAMMSSFIRRMGMDPDLVSDPTNLDPEVISEFDALAKSFSLVEQGVVGTGEKTIHIPLLIVNGTRDVVVSMDDFKLLEDASSDSETWLMGLAGHCAGNYMGVAHPDMMTWLVEKLNEEG